MPTMRRGMFLFDLNRRVPNGMHGGVRGEATPPLLDGAWLVQADRGSRPVRWLGGAKHCFAPLFQRCPGMFSATIVPPLRQSE